MNNSNRSAKGILYLLHPGNPVGLYSLQLYAMYMDMMQEAEGLTDPDDIFDVEAHVIEELADVIMNPRGNGHHPGLRRLIATQLRAIDPNLHHKNLGADWYFWDRFLIHSDVIIRQWKTHNHVEQDTTASNESNDTDSLP